MNNLSWLLYWADILPRVSALFTGVGAIGTLIGVIITLIFVTKGFGTWTEEYDEDFVNRFRFGPYLTIGSLLLTLPATLVPEKETFYLIAASEAGEEVAASPELTKARQVINNWLDKQLEKPDAQQKKEGE